MSNATHRPRRRLKDTLARLQPGRLTRFVLRWLPDGISRPLRAYRRQRLLSRYPQELAELQRIAYGRQDGQPMIVFPPGLDWDRSLFQRPQHLALALARQGALVFYVQPPENVLQTGFEWIEDNLLLCSLPVELLASLARPYVYILTWNAPYARLFDDPRLIYDVVDDLEAFGGNLQQLQRQHRWLLERAELVLATAANLQQQVRSLRPDALLCPNGVDYEKFAAVCPPADSPPPPADLAPILERDLPIIGYYGALARWFDYDLLQAVAALRPELSFVLIGPNHDGSLPDAMLDLPNVHWLGIKPYDRLTEYLAYFDLAIIPFRLNPITHATSPLKLFEYMAACKPVVITPMQESQRYPGVLVAKTPDAFARQVDAALRLAEDPDYLETIQQVARANTWGARAEGILQALARRQSGAERGYNEQSP